jgi:dTDP-4-dehydrorhamnose reductase
MLIAVTGGDGQLGRAFQNFFRENQIKCCALTRQDLDISDLNAVVKWVSENPVDFLINCAAFTNVDAAEENWRTAFLINGLGPRNLALAARKTGATLVHFSTDYVFNGNTTSPYTIVDRPDPVSRYGESKLLGEKLVQQLHGNYFIIRTSWLYGDGPENFPKKLRQWSQGKNDLRVVTDQVSTPTYAHDLAEGSWELIKTGAYGLYHLTNGGACSRFEWASHILQSTGWDGHLSGATENDFPTPARRPHFSVLDNFGSPETSGWIMPEWKDAADRYLKVAKKR